MLRTFASLFTGGGIADIGYSNAGLEHLWGIESNPAITEVAKTNQFNVYTDDVLNFLEYKLPSPDLLHASPPCVNFTCSHQPQESDILLSKAIAQWIKRTTPKAIVIEQVPAYFKHEAFKHILRKALDYGYFHQLIPRSDFSRHGVPQKRIRGIAIFTTEELPTIQLPKIEPIPTWWQTIKHLKLPRRNLCKWQKKLLQNKQFDCPVLVERQGGTNKRLHIVTADEPAFTIRAALALNGSTTFHNVILPNGNTTALNIEALRLLQAIPSSYKLPVNTKLAVKIIGNGVPPTITEMIANIINQALSNPQTPNNNIPLSYSYSTQTNYLTKQNLSAV